MRHPLTRNPTQSSLTDTHTPSQLERDTPWHGPDERSQGYYRKSTAGVSDSQINRDIWINTLISMQEAFAFYKFRRLHERTAKEMRPALVTWLEQTLTRHIADVLHELSLPFVNNRLDRQEAHARLIAQPTAVLPMSSPVLVGKIKGSRWLCIPYTHLLHSCACSGH